MAYPKKIWSETVKETVYPTDLNRIENGIEANDLEITKQKNPTIPGTLAKQIADNVTAIEENTNKINVLNNERGYLNSKLVSNLDTTKDNGKYVFWGNLFGITDGVWYVDVTKDSRGYDSLTQTAKCVYPKAIRIERDCLNGAWQPWQQIATTTKTSFSCSAKTGYTIVSQNCYTLNGMAYINIAIKKVDGSVFDSVQHALFTSPYYSTSLHYPINAVFTNGPLVGGFAYNGAIWTDGGCYITLTGNTATQINIHAEVPL